MSFVWRHFSDPLAQLCEWTMMAGLALPCLVAIWAAVGRTYWFWRVLAVWAVVMLMIPLRAWELAWAFTLAAVFIAVVVQLSRAVERRWNRVTVEARPDAAGYRYSLRDLLLFVLSVCLWLPGLVAAARHTPLHHWQVIAVFAAVLAGVSVIAAKLAFGPRRVRLTIMLAIGLPLAAFIIVRTVDIWTLWMFTGGPTEFWQQIAGVTIAELQFVLLVVGVIGLVQGVRDRGNAPRRRAALAGALTMVASASLISLGLVYVRLLQAPAKVDKFETTGNQYPRILEIASRMFVTNPKNFPVSAWRAGGGVQLADDLTALFDELLPLLEGDNAVPYDPATDATEDYIGPNVQAMRGLCRCLEAESEAALTSGQPHVAGEYALACVELSQAMGRGGLAVDALVSVALEGVGYSQLAKVRSGLSVDQLREALVTLARDEQRRDDFAVIRAREVDYDDRTRGFAARLETTYLEITGRKTPWEQSYLGACRRVRAENALLRIHLAAQLFRAERGREPATFEELVPDYLQSLPLDPYTSQPLRCKTEGGKLILYSVGRDGVDNGGQFTIPATYYSQDGYDLDLGLLTR